MTNGVKVSITTGDNVVACAIEQLGEGQTINIQVNRDDVVVMMMRGDIAERILSIGRGNSGVAKEAREPKARINAGYRNPALECSQEALTTVRVWIEKYKKSGVLGASEYRLELCVLTYLWDNARGGKGVPMGKLAEAIGYSYNNVNTHHETTKEIAQQGGYRIARIDGGLVLMKE